MGCDPSQPFAPKTPQILGCRQSTRRAGPINRTVGTMFVPGTSPRAVAERVARRATSLTLATAPTLAWLRMPWMPPLGLARSGSLYNVDGSPDSRVYIQMRGIEQVRIRGALQR